MKNDYLEKSWEEIELSIEPGNKAYQRMIYGDLLYRVYLGISGFPAKRFISLEIPIKDTEKFSTFDVPQGFSLSIQEPTVKHDGYAECKLQVSSFDQNDVFTIVSKDILKELSFQETADEYIDALINRIEKWKYFFKNQKNKRLSEKMIVGLIGELSFIDSMLERGITSIVDYWNGPVKAAQDFQWESFAIEVKTVSSSKLNTVHISSEVQLNDDMYEALFLVAYRVEKSDSSGERLAEYISKVRSRISNQQRKRFDANLFCLGYLDEDSDAYTAGYSIKECMCYRIKDDFPRLVIGTLPQGVSSVQYRLSIKNCEPYQNSIEEIAKFLKENDDGDE